MTDFAAVVEQIMIATGCDRAKAERVAAANGHTPPTLSLESTRAADVLEKQEQEYIKRLFREFGFKVRNTSQARRSKIAAGIPDLLCMHRELPIAFWFEVKKSVGGKLSKEQLEFRDDCARCAVGWASGDRHAARTHLIHLGLARVEGDVLEPIRREGTG